MNDARARGLSINTATVKEQFGFREVAEACAKVGITAFAPWRDQIASVGLDEAARIVRGNGLQVTGIIRGGMFPAADKAARLAAVEENKRAVDEAAALGADCLVLIAGGLPKGSKDISAAREMVAEGLAALLPYARANKVPLALEPLHPMYAADRACVTTLAEALDLCDLLAPDDGKALGVAIDTFHVWWDPALAQGIARAGKGGRILAHHICDWLVPMKDMLLDRGMMGDGVIDFRGFRRMIEAAGFHGPQEVEIFSAHDWWKRPGEEVLKVCIERYDALCHA
jgi:sugar phosphate isomerase/epimerase